MYAQSFLLSIEVFLVGKLMKVYENLHSLQRHIS